MANLDAAELAELARRLGLVTDQQLEECWEAIGPSASAEAFLRWMERKGYLTPYQTQKLLKGDQEGYFLGGYRLLYKIASGSFGRVFRADDPQTGRVVAIKVLRKRWSEDPHNIDLFEREGRVGLSLRHPNIVEILEVRRDTATRQYFIVMEFVEGGNLRDFLAIRKKLEPAEALQITQEAASGLAHAYSRGLTHRDIKLTNILISSQGEAKLVDFGLAAMEESRGSEDGTHVDRTVDYAGLEKATGAKKGDVRSDIFFLGCVLYEMLAGRPPLVMTKDRRARMQKQRFDNVQPLRRDEVNGPPSLFHVLETMMAFNPQQRYQTPSQLLETVREVRREVEGGGPSDRAAAGPRSVFVVESKPKYQDAIREKFKKMGFRVLISADPARARDRFQQQPFDALVMDAAAIGKEGVATFEQILMKAELRGLTCRGILILSQEQADWAERVKSRSGVTVLLRPVTLKQLSEALQELVPPAETDR